MTNQAHRCRSCSRGTDVHHSRPDPSDHAFHNLAGPRRRVPILIARPDAVRSRPVICFVRNDQHDGLCLRLTLPERAQPPGQQNATALHSAFIAY